MVSLHIYPAECLVDDTVSIVVTGLTAGQKITICATLEDDGKRFYSAAHYTADSQGIVDVSKLPSTGGTYVSIICGI